MKGGIHMKQKLLFWAALAAMVVSAIAKFPFKG
jgi:hypothetical protein